MKRRLGAEETRFCLSYVKVEPARRNASWRQFWFQIENMNLQTGKTVKEPEGVKTKTTGGEEPLRL